jgi:hypothetical protein
MSEENVEIVRAARVRAGGTTVGHEGIRRFFREMETFADSSSFEIEESGRWGHGSCPCSP